MDLIQESFMKLFPNQAFSYATEMEYNRRLGDFNANIVLNHNKIKVNLNLQWKDIDEEIKIGLIQHLLLKIFKTKQKSTQNIEIYNHFTKNISMLTPKTKIDPFLEESFQRINRQFLDHQVEISNLRWGKDSKRKLACYNFHSDTITVSTIFQDARQEVLDFLMYHEMLHKYYKFTHKNGRHSYHSREFKDAEKSYPNYQEIEKEIEGIIRKNRRIKIVPPKKTSLFRFF